MKTKRDNYTFLTTAPVHRVILTMAIPTIISMLVTSLYNMVDTYFVGKINTQCTAAVGVSFSMMAIIQAVGFFCGHGSGNYISQKLGAKQTEDAAIMAPSLHTHLPRHRPSWRPVYDLLLHHEQSDALPRQRSLGYGGHRDGSRAERLPRPSLHLCLPHGHSWSRHSHADFADMQLLRALRHDLQQPKHTHPPTQLLVLTPTHEGDSSRRHAIAVASGTGKLGRHHA